MSNEPEPEPEPQPAPGFFGLGRGLGLGLGLVMNITPTRDPTNRHFETWIATCCDVTKGGANALALQPRHP